MFIRFTRDYQAGNGRMYQGGEVIDVDKVWGNQLIAEGAATLNAGDAAVATFDSTGKYLVGGDGVVSLESWAGLGGSSLATTVYIGDSITANGWLQNLKTAFDSYGPYFYDDGTATGTRFARTEDYGFAAWADFLASGALGTFINSGIGGNTTTGFNQQDSTRRGNLPVASGDLKGVMKTPRIQIAAGAASAYDSRIRIYASAAGTVTIDISEYKMTQHP